MMRLKIWKVVIRVTILLSTSWIGGVSDIAVSRSVLEIGICAWASIGLSPGDASSIIRVVLGVEHPIAHMMCGVI